MVARLLLPLRLRPRVMRCARGTPVAVRWISATRAVKGIRRHQQKVPASLAVATPEELRALAATSADQTTGSLRYHAAFRHWSTAAIALLRQELSHILPHPLDRVASARLQAQLGRAATVGAMPSFADPGARTGYALNFFSRALRLAHLLFDTRQASMPSFMGEALDEMLFSAGTSSAPPAAPFVGQLTSIGGGPGYDFVAAALVTSFHAMARDKGLAAATDNHDDDENTRPTRAPMTTIRATVLDYEKGWYDLVDAMTGVIQTVLPNAQHTCAFGICDITKPLTDPSNRACLAQVECTDLWVVQYCVAENATLLRASDYVFFTELFAACPEGALFVFTETTYRQWPELVDCMGDATFDVAFPKPNGRIMLLRKRRGARIRDEQLALCDKFRRVQEQHAKRMARGIHCQRQA
jgi:hypothetical protein